MSCLLQENTGLKTGGPPCYILSARSRKKKNITNIEQKRLFLFTFFASFLWRFMRYNLFTQ